MFFDISARQRGGQKDSRITLAVIEIYRHQEFLLCQPLWIGKVRPSAIGKGKASVRSGSASSDSVGIGTGQHHTYVLGTISVGLPILSG
jgi:hypothetical protein